MVNYYIVYIATWQGRILQSFNGGLTWTLCYYNDDHYLFAICFVNELTGIATGHNGIMLKTTDGGATWNTIQCGTNDELKSISFVNESVGYISGGEILKTTDGGNTWTVLDAGTVYDYRSISFADYNTGYAAGMSGTIIKTPDGGKTWTNYPDIINGYFNSICATTNNTVFVAGVYGTIMKTDNGGGSVNVKEVEKEESGFTIYPNPAKTKITITNENKVQGEVSIRLYNIQGRLLLIKEFSNKNLMEMELGGFKDGIYLVKIQTEAGILARKVVIQY